MIVAGVAIIILVSYWLIYRNTVSKKYRSGKHLKNWDKGPGTEYNQIVKFAQRNLGLK